jgi:hypothetical protein
MANFAATVLLAARAKEAEKYYRAFEGRALNSSLINLFMRNRDLMNPNLADIRKSTTQVTSMMYPTKLRRTMGAGKSCAPSGESSDSGIVNLTWVVKTALIKISEKLHQGNEYKMQDTLARELVDAELDLWKNGAASMEVAALTYLEANRTQVAETVGVHGVWDGTNFNYDYPVADIDIFYNKLVDDIRMNNFNGEMLEAYNTGWGYKLRYQANQGETNATNLAYQQRLPIGFTGFESNLITMTTDGSTHYFVHAGGVTILDWNDPINVEGKVSGDKTWTRYESKFFPGLMLDMFMVTACEDTTSIGGGTQDFTHTYELALTYAFAKAPLSTANASPIIKANILLT